MYHQERTPWGGGGGGGGGMAAVSGAKWNAIRPRTLRALAVVTAPSRRQHRQQRDNQKWCAGARECKDEC